jgi:hypothetical protein
LANHPTGLHNLGLAAETAQIDTLLVQLAAVPAAAAIGTLGLASVVTRLQEGNAAYKLAVSEADVLDTHNTPQNWRAAAPVRWLGSHFLSGLAFRAIEDASFRPVVDELTNALTESISVARARNTRRANDEEPVPPPIPG